MLHPSPSAPPRVPVEPASSRRAHTFTLQATPLRCDVIVGCEDGLLGCIMGCGARNAGSDAAACHQPAEHEASSSNNDLTASHPTAHSVDSEAQFAASAALERMIRVATADAAGLEAEEVAQVSAAAAAAFAAAEEQDAGVFRAVRVHDAAVLCAGVMLCAPTIRSFRVFVLNSSACVRAGTTLGLFSCPAAPTAAL